MDNLAHSLVGAALAELALRREAPPAPRRLFLAAGVILLNLLIDLLYAFLDPRIRYS